MTGVQTCALPILGTALFSIASELFYPRSTEIAGGPKVRVLARGATLLPSGLIKEPRAINFRLFYPSAGGVWNDGCSTPYIIPNRSPSSVHLDKMSNSLFWSNFASHFSVLDVGSRIVRSILSSAKANSSFLSPPLSVASSPLPLEVPRLVVFSHGRQLPPEFYTATLEEFASHGFVVAAPLHSADWDTIYPGPKYYRPRELRAVASAVLRNPESFVPVLLPLLSGSSAGVALVWH